MIRSARLGPILAQLAQAMRLLLDDLEHGFATGAHQRRRIDRPHAADHREAEIFLDPLDRPRCRSLEERGSELDTKRTVIDLGPDRPDELAGQDDRRMAKDGDQVALPLGP